MKFILMHQKHDVRAPLVKLVLLSVFEIAEQGGINLCSHHSIVMRARGSVG
jgi:hypothetical protein